MKTKIRLATYAQKLVLVFLCLFLMAVGTIHAEGNRFDLIGPNIEMKVSRNGKSLPIASVPNLQGGDKLWVQVDFPETQSEHYLLIVAFLQGPTNPPPDDWFTAVETWNKKEEKEGTL